MKRMQENIFSNLTLNFPLILPSLKEGLQSHRVTSDFRQHVSLALERQLSGQLANSLINLQTQQQSPVPALAPIPSFPAAKPAKHHPPLTASNSVANCNAASHLKTLVAREHRKLDRSVSEPADKSQQRQPPQNSSRYKTELCRPFEENGTCKYGDKCQFAHGYGELRTLSRHPKYKTELCRTFHSTGFCPYGPRCHFIHNSEEAKKCLITTLQSGNSPANDYDVCGFSIGSAGELSPTSSVSSVGSPTSSLGFFLDDVRPSCPLMTGNRFFGGNYQPLSVSVAPRDEYLSQQTSSSDEEILSSVDLLVSELELDSCDSDSIAKPGSSPAMDVDRNLIRLPIFSRLALGSSP